MRITIVAKLALAALVLAAAGALASCNTIGGFGEDVSAAGNAVTKSSETTQKKM